jgi:PAS domain S-box-containing protein
LGKAGKWRISSSFRLRTYFAGLIAVFAAAALAGVFYARHQSEQNARSQALQEAGFAARSASKVLGEGVTILQGALGGLAADPRLPALLAHPSQCELSWGQVGAFPSGHLDILRPDGTVVCTSLRSASRQRMSYAGQPWLTAARSAPQTLAPGRDPITHRPAAILTAPFRGGIAVAVVDLNPVGRSLATQLAGPKDLRYVVTTADGRFVLARSTQSDRFVGSSIARTAFFRQEGSTQHPDLGGTTRLFAQATVPGLGWRVYAGLDRSVALASAGSLFDRELLLILAALVVVLAASAVVQRRIARPIHQLRDSVRSGGVDSRAVVAGAPTEVVDLAGSFDDLLSSLRAAEQEASDSADAYRELFHSHPQPMWIYDRETLEIFEVNSSAVEHYGYSREEFLAMTIKDLRPAEDVPALLESVAGAGFRDGSGPWRHVKRDGTVIEVEVASHVVEFLGRSGRLIVASDVTERQRISRQLEQVQRLESLGQLAGGVAHDFNNLLGVILNYATFVKEQLNEADRDGWDMARDDVAQIEQAARRASDLTHQLLAFARREVIHPDVISLNDSVARTRQLLRRSLGEHIELSTVLEGDLWPVLADPGQMEQILINLAVNARDAMPGGGRLMIETANVDVDESYATARPGISPGRYVRLRVTDTGEGMDQATLERAFEPFFTTKPQGEGTGLGLATIYGIVTQAGGYIRLYSERGFGTGVTVMLPATAEQPPPARPEDARDLVGNGETVLVVEDEDGIRDVARRILERRGYEVLTAPGGTEALELLGAHDAPIDLLITDVIMPRMMGPELAAEIAALRPSTRIIYMSGYAQPLVGSAQGVPADTILIEKPFTEHALLMKVREALGKSAPHEVS